MRAFVEYSHARDAAAWMRQHDRGEVPNALPYGLDRLSDSDITPVARTPLPPGAWRSVARVARRGGYQWVEAARATVPADIDVVICWDERSGAPRARQDGHRLPVASGAIWITDYRRRPIHRAAARALRSCSLVWVHSRPQLDVLAEMGLSPERLAFLHFGVDADFFRRPGEAVREPGLIVSAGNDRDRDWPTLLHAFSIVRRLRPQARLEVVTQSRLPTEPGVTVHSHLAHTKLRDIYSRAWAIAVPTKPNLHLSGLTNALESKAMGVPFVMAGTAGTSDYVRQGENGYLYEPGDVQALADRLLDLLNADLAETEQMGAIGRADVERQQNTGQHAATLAALIRGHC